jgi:ABC-2 type transport system permease protein
MRLAANGESGILKIAIYMENPEDELSRQILDTFTSREGAIIYITCKTEEEARECVNDYTVDFAWIFPSDLRERLAEVATKNYVKPVVTVVERWETVANIFAKEILCNALYPELSYDIYVNFMRNDLGLADISDSELREAYEMTLVEGNLFQMEYPDGEKAEESNYLLAPIRGILAIWLVLCGFAASMYFMQDEQRGTFMGMSSRGKFVMSYIEQAVLLSDTTVVLIVALKLSGTFTAWSREIICAVLFAVCVMAFCNLLRLLVGKPERLGSVIPLTLLCMMILCPVFIDVNGFKTIQYLLPAYYYLKGIHSDFYLYGILIYSVVLVILSILLDRLKTLYNFKTKKLRKS